jgi:hypothetical protein
MREFAAELDFDFLPIWAVMLPLEKVLAYRGEEGYATLSSADEQLINSLALPLDKALASAQRNDRNSCILLENQIAMDFRGDVQLCCAAYDGSKFTVANFLETPINRIQQLRYARDTCATCMKNGVHDYFLSNVPEIERLALDNVERYRRAQLEGKDATS